ncbi:MAG: phosphoribosylanthranilate isomerase [Hyphomonadaceae bacterium]|nr:MAG: phosphoribosylanthranilate isomerase [Hyphomonadaceae bacterium]
MNKAKVKICGLTTAEAVETATLGGADYLGFVFHPKSPRNINIDNATALANLALTLNPDVQIIAVTVDPDDEFLRQIADRLSPDYVQLHGNESLARVKEVRSLGFKTIKAIGIENENDLQNAVPFFDVADFVLFDAKPPKGEKNAGGFGAAFDWGILQGFEHNKPWFLSGGLNHDNVGAAIAATGAPMVDVSSGVESAVGVKDLALIKSFLNAAKGS